MTFAITGNNQFVYAPISFDASPTTLSALRRESDGTLQFTNINETDPPPPFSDGEPNQPQNVTADPTNHLAVALDILAGDAVTLASYTVDAQGNVASNNTLANMPIDEANSTAMQMSPSGKLLALASNYDYPTLQVFNFNGANPITPHGGQLKHPLVLIDQIQWDNNDHLYALNDATKKLYVYSVTPTTIVEAPGSPFTITSPNRLNALVVVSNLCTAPAADGVNICLPVSGSIVSSPVLVEATAKVTGTIASTQLSGRWSEEVLHRLEFHQHVNRRACRSPSLCSPLRQHGWPKVGERRQRNGSISTMSCDSRKGELEPET